MPKRSTKHRVIPDGDRRRAKAAYNLLGRIQEAANFNPNLSNEEMMAYGRKLHEYTYDGGSTDDEALERLIRAVTSDTLVGSDILKVQLQIPNEQCMMLWAGRWVDQGCPRVVFDSKYASLLMATDVGRDMVDKIVFPWKAFLLEMPEGLLSITDAEDVLHGIRKVYVHVMRAERHDFDTLNVVAMTEHGLQLWRHGLKPEELTTAKVCGAGNWDFGFKTDSRDDRVLNLVGRLVISMCVAMSDPDNYRKQKPGRKKKGRRTNGKPKTKTSELPEIQTFVIGRPTKINCRQALVDYVEGRGTRKSPTVRFLVRGHWKFQPYGPGRSLRKLIQIEPYWKGPEEAKILARTVKMDTNSAAE